MGPARRLLRLSRALPPLQRGPGAADPGARARPPTPRVCGTWKGQGEASGPVEGPWRPENGSLFPGVMWEPRTGEASISLFRLYFVYSRCLPPAPADSRTVLGGGRHKSPLLAPRETVSGKGHSGKWGFTWGIIGPPSPPRDGPGQGWSISLGLQGSKRMCCSRDFRVLRFVVDGLTAPS